MEAVCDHLRAKGLKVAVVNITMFRPFPTDLIAGLLRGKKAVTVLERVDQPLAVDPPLMREIRAALSKATENARARGSVPHPGVPPCRSEEVPEFFSGCFGLGSRDVQAGDLIAAFENMYAEGGRRRQFYMGIDFVRPATRLPKLELWQQQLLEAYPRIRDLAVHAPLPENDAELHVQEGIVRCPLEGGAELFFRGSMVVPALIDRGEEQCAPARAWWHPTRRPSTTLPDDPTHPRARPGTRRSPRGGGLVSDEGARG